MKKHMRFLFLSLFLYPLLPGLSCAGAPLKINFQGRLEDGGLPAQGTKTFTFKLYDALSGGSLVWTSQAESVAVANGAFSVVLETGTAVNLSTAVFSGARYVEIIVDGVPLSPRQEMVSAPYAMVAQSLSADAVVSLSNLEKDPSAPSTINTSTNAVDWSQLKNVPAGFADGIDDTLTGGLSTAAITSGKFSDDRVYITTGAIYGGFNGADQLVQLTGTGKLPALDGSALTGVNSAAMGVLSAQVDNVAASTGALTMDLAAVALSTGQLAAQIGDITGSTSALTVNLSAVILSTGAIDAAVSAETAARSGADAALNTRADNIAASTGTLTADLAAVILSTGVISADLTAETGARTGADSAVNARVDSVAASTGTLTANLAAVVLSTGPLANSGSWNGALSVGGAMTLPIKTITFADTPYFVTGNDSTIVVDASGGAIDINLPDATAIPGRVYTFKLANPANAVNFLAAQNIDGGAGYAFFNYGWAAVTFQSTGAEWIILNYF